MLKINSKLFNLHKVAKTGKYDDLDGKPTIPVINNTLTSASTEQALSAAQGKNLNDRLAKLEKVNLYNNENGTVTSFTVNSDFSGFEFIEVYTSIGYQKISAPNGKKTFFSNVSYSDTIYNYSMVLDFSGKNVTISNNKNWYLSTVQNNINKVYRIDGYKK